MPATIHTHPRLQQQPTPVEVVEAFLAALEALDVEAARALMAPDIRYQNVPYPVARGRDATERVLRSFLVAAKGFEVEMLSIAGQGDMVLTERVDTFTNGPFRAGFWVCGTFQVRDGQIALWRDRFDHVDMALGLVRGLLGIPLRLLRG